MDESTPTEIEPTQPTQIPVTEPGQTQEEAEATPPVSEVTEPVVPVDTNAVPGTPDGSLTLGEHTGIPQPEAPQGTPAVATPSQDAVSVNERLNKVADDLGVIVEYVRTVLGDHPVSEVREELETIISKVRSFI